MWACLWELLCASRECSWWRRERYYLLTVLNSVPYFCCYSEIFTWLFTISSLWQSKQGKLWIFLFGFYPHILLKDTLNVWLKNDSLNRNSHHKYSRYVSCCRCLCHDVWSWSGKTCISRGSYWAHAGMPWCCSSLCSTEGAIRPSDWWISVLTGLAMQPIVSCSPVSRCNVLLGS